MNYFLLEWILFPKLSVSRRLLILIQIRVLAIAFGIDALKSLCDTGIDRDRKLAVMENQLASAKAEKSDPRLMNLDPRIDHEVGSMFRTLKDRKKSYKGKPNEKMVDTLMLKCFPHGAAGITREKYVEQGLAVNLLISALENEYAEEVRQLGLNFQLEILKPLSQEFSDILAEVKSKKLTYEDIRVANNDGQAYLMEVLVFILQRYAGASEDKLEERNKFLEPFLDQKKELKRYKKSHKPAPEVNPDSGELIPEGSEHDQPSESAEVTSGEDTEHGSDSHTHNIQLTME